MSTGIGAPSQETKFDSSDIRKKDLKFSVYEKDSAKFNRAVTGFWQKIRINVSNSPLFRGKNKYMTLGVVILVVAASISLPIVLPHIIATSDSSSEQSSRDDTAVRQQQKDDTSAMLKELDPNASEDAKNAIVASLDEKIANSISDEESQFYKSSKAYALSTFSNNGGALTELESLADEYRASKKFTDVARSYYTMSYLSEQSGDLASALKYAKNALAVIDEAKNDPEKPRTVAGAELYQSRINELEGKQQ